MGSTPIQWKEAASKEPFPFFEYFHTDWIDEDVLSEMNAQEHTDIVMKHYQDMDVSYDISEIFRTRLIPDALRWYTGEALEQVDAFDSEEDEDVDPFGDDFGAFKEDQGDFEVSQDPFGDSKYTDFGFTQDDGNASFSMDYNTDEIYPEVQFRKDLLEFSNQFSQ